MNGGGNSRDPTTNASWEDNLFKKTNITTVQYSTETDALAHNVCTKHKAKFNSYLPAHNPYSSIPSIFMSLSKNLLIATVASASTTIPGSAVQAPNVL